MSETDIRAGGRWLADLNTQLEQTDFGIVVLTPESLTAPWLHYEAGALAKKVVGTGGVCPYLVDISEETAVTGPLAQFQAKLANEDGTLDLLKGINQRMEGRGRLDDARLNDAFKAFWPRLENTLSSLPAAAAQQAKRSPDELLQEILERVRSIERRFPDGSRIDKEGALAMGELARILSADEKLRELFKNPPKLIR